jgi:molybdopterin biosynthesis enzyme
MHGRLDGMHVLGLPGNPVSAYVCAVLFFLPLLRRLDERADYMRATLERRADGILIATPFRAQDSSLLVPLASVDCLLIREPFAPAAEAGSPCDHRQSSILNTVWIVHSKLRGCRTHMERIVSVHDLFWWLCGGLWPRQK